jgi:hypothetical protein
MGSSVETLRWDWRVEEARWLNEIQAQVTQIQTRIRQSDGSPKQQAVEFEEW